MVFTIHEKRGKPALKKSFVKGTWYRLGKLRGKMSFDQINLKRSMWHNARREEAVFLATKKEEGPPESISTDKLHFASLRIDDISNCNSPQQLVNILEANRISKPETTLPHLKVCVLFEKFYWLHYVTCDPRKCGGCRTTVYDGMRCSQCKMYHYCSRKCQGEHWKHHKPFCSLISTRTIERERTNSQSLRERPELAEQMKSNALSRQWDGKPNTLFEDFTKSIQNLIEHRPNYAAMAVSAFPPNITQAYGPDTFLKFTRFLLEQSKTSFTREAADWLQCLASFFDPYWPERHEESSNYTLTLRPNAEVFLRSNEMMDLLFSMLLTRGKTEIPDPCFLTIFYLSLYDGGIPEPPWPSNETETPFLDQSIFGNLTTDLHLEILRFLSPCDLLELGRSCRTAADMVMTNASATSIKHCQQTLFLAKFFNGWETSLQSLEEDFTEGNKDLNELRRIISNRSADEFLQSRRKFQLLYDRGLQFNAIMIRLLRSFCSHLQISMILQKPGSSICPFTKILVFRIAAKLVFFKRTFLDRFSKIFDFFL